ncbi:methionine synthase [Geitlerinema sp. P-1104]|uniref:Npun_R2821/Npun_R2822 family protein n=1 Tax=Geitlerinema sp. P-1104 TaxID=2546230 RepID=UPI0014771888|nr:Npun_R2821/Npun_R2822 family protein [Geitlerinema sp. P-1104]NMG60587.1 methionine synthase [Geitlerinema sp. P-1104]
MESRAIYTLANDVVYDQLVALLNSIEANVGTDIPVCVIPYDDRLERVKSHLEQRENVSLFDKTDILEQWDQLVNDLWESHSRAQDPASTYPAWYQGFVHRKFAAFDGDHDKFIFMDADSLAMKQFDDIFDKLDEYDLVFNDWEHAKPREVTEVDLSKIEAATELSEAEIRPKLHCDSFFGSKQGLLGIGQLDEFRKRAIEHSEIEWVRPRSWWSSSGLFTYMTFPGDLKMFNFTRSDNPQERTGNCADADPFVSRDGVLYNEEGLKPIHRIHYMNYSSTDFARLTQGEDVKIRYQDTFLHYRFLKEPHLKPTILKPANPWVKAQRKLGKAVKKAKNLFLA